MEDILKQDVLDCGDWLTQTETDNAARSFVRAEFAMIEGSVFNLKQMALNLSTHGTDY